MNNDIEVSSYTKERKSYHGTNMPSVFRQDYIHSRISDAGTVREAFRRSSQH